jgi:large conductance mechanosensitive channel
LSGEDIQEKMLDELKKIREAVEPKPEPPAEPKKEKGFIDNFLEFLNKYGVVGLAIAVIIGGAASKLVTALVNDILMPVISILIPGGSWRDFELVVGPMVFLVGHFIGALIDFLIIALVVYLLMKQLEKTRLT